jgi:hypothetical protein
MQNQRTKVLTASTSPCLLAIPAVDRIAGLYNRHLTLLGGYAYANDLKSG